MERARDTRLEEQIAKLKAKLAARPDKSPEQVAAIDAKWSKDRDMLRRWLLDYLEAGSLTERLDRSRGGFITSSSQTTSGTCARSEPSPARRRMAGCSDPSSFEARRAESPLRPRS